MYGPGVKILVNAALFALFVLVSSGIVYWWYGGGGDNIREDGLARAMVLLNFKLFALIAVVVMGADAALASAYKYPKNVLIFSLLTTILSGGLVAYFSLGGLQLAIPFVSPLVIMVCILLAIRMVRTAVARSDNQSRTE